MLYGASVFGVIASGTSVDSQRTVSVVQTHSISLDAVSVEGMQTVSAGFIPQSCPYNHEHGRTPSTY